MLGEWSLGLPPPGTVKNPVVTDEDYKKFGEVQLDIYGKVAKAGWVFWTYKVEDEVNTPWNFQDLRGRGWLPFEEIDQWDRVKDGKQKDGSDCGAHEIVRNGDGGRNVEVF